jgi:AcrR family transcriptional regulator
MGGSEPPVTGRERVLDAAYDLFSHNGVSGVGVDALIAEAGVAKATLYRNFASKEELAIAFLDKREERWTNGWVRDEVYRRESDPRQRLLAIFDIFDEWFHEPEFEGCAFITVLLEIPQRDDKVHQACVDHLANIRAIVAGLATEAGVEDPDAFARQWHILMKGSIVSAQEGDEHAARRAKEIGALLLDKYAS